MVHIWWLYYRIIFVVNKYININCLRLKNHLCDMNNMDQDINFFCFKIEHVLLVQ